MRSAMEIIRTLQFAHGLGEDTILRLMADYVESRCNLEDFEDYMLDRAEPEVDEEDQEEHTIPTEANNPHKEYSHEICNHTALHT